MACFHQCQQVIRPQGADLQQGGQRGVVVNLPAVFCGWAAAPLLAPPLAGEPHRLASANAIGLFVLLSLLPLGAPWAAKASS